jgi:hypothetical protein
VSSPLTGSYSFLGLTLSKSLYFHGLGVVIFVVGTGREIVALRRGSGRLAGHSLRVLAYLLFASFFFVAVKYLADANPPHWAVVLSFALILTAVCIFIATGRRGPAYRPGKHAGQGQESKTETR